MRQLYACMDTHRSLLKAVLIITVVMVSLMSGMDVHSEGGDWCFRIFAGVKTWMDKQTIPAGFGQTFPYEDVSEGQLIEGVDPTTLIWRSKRFSFPPSRKDLFDLVERTEFGNRQFYAVKVTADGVIIDGHKRTKLAIILGRAVEVHVYTKYRAIDHQTQAVSVDEYGLPIVIPIQKIR